MKPKEEGPKVSPLTKVRSKASLKESSAAPTAKKAKREDDTPRKRKGSSAEPLSEQSEDTPAKRGRGQRRSKTPDGKTPEGKTRSVRILINIILSYLNDLI